MDRHEFYLALNEKYQDNAKRRRLVSKAANATTALCASGAAMNYFLAPDDRLLFTAVPAVGALGAQLAKRALGAGMDRIDDMILDAAFHED